jgi:3',5'-cyclic AMP phosphodiesterase CpdA
VRRRGPVALVGVSTAIATGPFHASGQVGHQQLEKLGDRLAHLGREGAFRIVLIHHPLEVERRHWSKRLLDAGALKATLAMHGAELVLHGHMHVASEHLAAGHPPAHVIGVPSASADPARAKTPAGYALFRIEPSETGWSVTMERRGFVSPGRIGKLEGKSFAINRLRA